MLAARRALAIGMGSALSRVTGRGRSGLRSTLSATAHWPAERLDRWRQGRLRALVQHAIERVPHYGDLDRGVLDPGLDLPAMLERIPILTKDDLRGAGTRLLARGARPAFVASTSGSSGSPATIHVDVEGTAWVRAAQRRGFGWHGVDPMEPRVVLLAAPRGALHRLKHRAVDLAIWRRLFQFADLSNEGLLETAAYIERYKPSFVTAYPSVLAALCNACFDAGVDLKSSGIRMLHSQSEVLQDVHRETFRRVFGDLPILDEYGCVEVGAMAYNCPRGAFHPSHDHVIFEVVDDDGRPVEPGESGRVLLTPLHNKAMPLLRYDLGDRATMCEHDCPDHFPGSFALERIDGRTFEVILATDGSQFSGGIVHFLVKKAGAVAEIREYLAVQERAGELRFDVVPQAGSSADLDRRLTDAARVVFGDRLHVHVRLCDQVMRPEGRKARYFVSEIEAGA